jgi:class 3 adenylate cyclase
MASTRQKTITSNSMPRQTVVGKVIIEKNTKILILLVLIMMIAMIFFNSKVYTQDPDVCVDDIEIFKYLLEADDPDTIDSNIDSLINKVLNEKYESHDIQLVEYNLLEYGKKFRTENYWSTMTVNCTQQVIRSEKSYDIFIAFITRKMTVYESMLNILKMICLIGVLFLGSYLFTKDANRMILAPIENIMCLVNLIAKNPDISYELMEMDQEAKRAKYDEMKLIERAILKLGALLMFVFGRAGNNVIYSNISNIRSENIDVETVGTSSFAIFGFCDIRNFTDMTEILEEGIMPFVNTVAKVVHSSVIKFMGSANKNIGDAFLLVWNLPEECFNAVQEDPQAEAQSSNIFLERYAESAIASFVEIIINLAGSTEVQNFAKLPKVQSKLPNFKVKMGFGMHMGWAIEGAIGSEWKIDASYLSPNVNISSRLEAATKHYGVPLLISHPVYNCLSNRTKAYCRQIDRVTLKGSEEPIGLYTIDIDAENVVRRPSLGSAPALTLGSKLGVKDMENLSPHELKNLYLQEDFYFNIETLVPKVKQHSLRDDNFDGAFRKAIKSYLDGKWNQAYEQLQNCLLLRPNDGPTQNILEYIKSYGKNSPPQWNGVRNLTEK